jgi:predicted phosphoribosyltransferase
MKFSDRTAAGRALAGRLQHYAGRDDILVLALPRGGVPVAFEIARDLEAPLEVFLARKLGVPGREELAMGAIAEGGITVLSQELMLELGIPQRAVTGAIAREQQELERRERLYRGGRPSPAVRGKAAILVDDALATGSTMRAAAGALRRRGARRIVVAVPVAAAAACEQFRGEVDEVVCARTPEQFRAVGEWYDDFSQTTDEEVCRLLSLARKHAHEA